MRPPPDSQAAIRQRYLRATLVTLARQDWRDDTVVHQLARVSVGRFGSLALAPEVDPEARMAATRDYAGILLAALARLREPGFDLPRFVDEQFDEWYAQHGAIKLKDVAPVGDVGPPPAEARRAGRVRFGRVSWLILVGIAAMAVGTWVAGLPRLLREDSAEAPLPTAEVRLAFARESEQQRSQEQIAEDFRLVLAENGMRPPILTLSPEGLFAHAPSRLDMTVRGRRLFLAYGIRAAAWEGESPTDGACFVVKAENNLQLFERCIDPRVNVEDRRIQVGFVSIPRGLQRLTLEITCKGHCASDWTFWRFIRME